MYIVAKRCNGNAILAKFSLAAPGVVKMITRGAVSGDNFVKMNDDISVTVKYVASSCFVVFCCG